MFEVGEDYEIVVLETGENYEGKWGYYESKTVYELAAVEGSVLKLLGPDFSRSDFDDLLGTDDESRYKPREVVIVNTASLFFLRATKIHKSAQGIAPE